MNCDIEFLLTMLNAAKAKGATSVNFYRRSSESKTNPTSLDFVLDCENIKVDDMLIYGHKPNQIHLELPIVAIK